ncbi:hypothetical protein KC19_VG228700 [Ceratodon purpureus]|nr:hypothetical protein KC19_VG228700 [Ceratodon purpureus]
MHADLNTRLGNITLTEGAGGSQIAQTTDAGQAVDFIQRSDIGHRAGGHEQFCRTMTVAELQPSDIRPQHVLWETLQYLMRILERSDYTFHAFLFDRTRAVQQELDMQCIANSQAITMFEEIVSWFFFQFKAL